MQIAVARDLPDFFILEKPFHGVVAGIPVISADAPLDPDAAELRIGLRPENVIFKPAFEISPDGESGVFYNSLTLRSDRRRQPIDLMILCSDKVLSADGAVDHIVGIPHPPLTPEIVGDKLVAVSLPEPSFGPVDAHRLNGRPAAPFDQTITVILGFEMLTDDAEERGKILNVYEK